MAYSAALWAARTFIQDETQDFPYVALSISTVRTQWCCCGALRPFRAADGVVNRVVLPPVDRSPSEPPIWTSVNTKVTHNTIKVCGHLEGLFSAHVDAESTTRSQGWTRTATHQTVGTTSLHTIHSSQTRILDVVHHVVPRKPRRRSRVTTPTSRGRCA